MNAPALKIEAQAVALGKWTAQREARILLNGCKKSPPESRLVWIPPEQRWSRDTHIAVYDGPVAERLAELKSNYEAERFDAYDTDKPSRDMFCKWYRAQPSVADAIDAALEKAGLL